MAKLERLIAEWLAPRFPGRLVIAGRNIDKAQRCATHIGHGAIGRSVDVLSGEAAGVLEEVDGVLVCLDQKDTRFVERCLSRRVC